MSGTRADRRAVAARGWCGSGSSDMSRDRLRELFYQQADQRFPMPAPIQERIWRLAEEHASNELAYLTHMRTLMDDEPEIGRVYALRGALVAMALHALQT